jgi:hypothetical protein
VVAGAGIAPTRFDGLPQGRPRCRYAGSPALPLQNTKNPAYDASRAANLAHDVVERTGRRTWTKKSMALQSFPAAMRPPAPPFSRVQDRCPSCAVGSWKCFSPTPKNSHPCYPRNQRLAPLFLVPIRASRIAKRSSVLLFHPSSCQFVQISVSKSPFLPKNIPLIPRHLQHKVYIP